MVYTRSVIRSRWSACVLLLLLAATALSIWGCGVAGGAATTGGDGSSLLPLMVEGKYGYVDQMGRMVIKPQFARAAGFSEGLAYAELPDNGGTRAGYIDATGGFVIEPKESAASGASPENDFSEGLAAQTLPSGMHCYIDKTGKVLIPGPFDMVQPFKDGLAIVGVPPAQMSDDLFGLIDRTGRWVVPPRYKELDAFSEGLASMRTLDGLWGYIDTTGRVVITPRFRSPSEDYPTACGAFSSGLAPAHGEKGWGFIDRTGSWVIPPKFENVCRFSEGLAAAVSGGKTGFIDTSGGWVIQPSFEAAGEFSQGLATARSGGLWGMIDRSGEMVIAPQYLFQTGFQDGLAVVQPHEGNTETLIDTSGARLSEARPVQ